MGLAEDIIENYQDVRKKIEEGRKSFLAEKNKKLTVHIKEKGEKFSKNLEYRKNHEERQKIKHKLLDTLHKIEKQSWWNQESASPDHKKIKLDLKFFTSKLLKPIQEKVEARRLKENKEFLMTFVKSKSKPKLLDIEESKRLYHPPSKVLLKPTSSQKDYMGLDPFQAPCKTARKRNESVEDFKLHLHSPLSARNPVNFKNFYSGGPSDENLRIFQVKFTIK